MSSSPTLTATSVAAARDILSAGQITAGGPISLACSFSAEDVVLVDLIHDAGLDAGIFAIDTGRLPEETYEVAEALCQRYGVKIDWYFPQREAVEQLEREKGLYSFRESLANRRECCHIRKVEPLCRALAGLAGWVTGLRRAQNVTRQRLEAVAADADHGGLLKISPLLDWNDAELWDYVATRRLPRNRLYRQGYASIGCAPCTRAIQPGENQRAGRWWWEDPEHKECGLHCKPA